MMYKLFYILLCIIPIILIGKLINVDTPNQPKLLARTGGGIERGNFSYFYIKIYGSVILNLSSILGDADIYISDTNMYPSYDPDSYSLHSATCGDEIIEIPESYDSPLALGVYGYAESSYFILDVYENPDIPYPYRYVVMEMATSNPKESQKDNDGQQSIKSAKDDSENQRRSLKRKRTKNSSSIPSIFSILEVLQLIFL